ncbi:MAG: efflux RND transporter periplasmic adaptor subunit [Desulfosarcinaceae bacterium]|nr:efflux RND transporter periplasmic adaptor subunit [Desulfosarcinaceae bacterium]
MKLFTRIALTLLGLIVVLGAIGAVKGLQIGRMVAHSEAFAPPPQAVTVAAVNTTTWESTLQAVGSLTAVQGVMVTAELAGQVERIAFEPGARVSAGDLLIQQDIAVETAQLRSAESDADLALKNLERARKLVEEQVIPRADFDERQSRYDRAVAQVDLIRATIANKTIRAPFEGRLGIRHVNLGEVLESGQPIVSLQSLDPIYVDFQLPQQQVGRLRPGLTVRVSVEAIEEQAFEGRVTAINPEVDSRSRNITVQATIANPDERLRPGMFATVDLILPEQQSVLIIPATAVAYAPYSDSVFVVESGESGTEGDAAAMVLRQQFVRLGEQRGDFVAVLQGLEAGEQVVSTGVFKLRNGQNVVVDNRLAPTFESAPQPDNA